MTLIREVVPQLYSIQYTVCKSQSYVLSIDICIKFACCVLSINQACYDRIWPL